MADETPEQIRERVHAEELAKGSDPRVAEGRAKAAELRARHGLPIDPEQAWRAKLEQEGGAPAAPPEAPEQAPPEEAPAPEPEEGAPEEAAVEEAPAEEEVPPSEPAAEAPAETAPPAVKPREPEVGEPIEVDTEGLEELAGIKLRDPRLPAWLVAVLLVIIVWAGGYLLIFRGEEAVGETADCRVEPDRTLVCFEEEPPTGP